MTTKKSSKSDSAKSEVRISVSDQVREITVELSADREEVLATVDDVMRLTGDRGRGNVVRTMKALCDLGICKRVPRRARSIRPVYIKFRNIQ